MRTPQREEDATYAPMFERGFGEVDFAGPAKAVADLIRGATPEPGAYAFLEGAKVKLTFAEPVEGNGQPGEILLADPKKGLLVAAGSGAVRISRLQYPGAKEMPAGDFLRGKGKFLRPGMRFGR